MRILFLLLLIVFFIFSLFLVVFNSATVHVDLLFTKVPEMSVGLIIVLTLMLGVLIGLLLGIQLFRVFQTRWEISRLRREVETIRAKHIKAVEAAAQQSTTPTAVATQTPSSVENN